jgi:hypothetical protein
MRSGSGWACQVKGKSWQYFVTFFGQTVERGP